MGAFETSDRVLRPTVENEREKVRSKSVDIVGCRVWADSILPAGLILDLILECDHT